MILGYVRIDTADRVVIDPQTYRCIGSPRASDKTRLSVRKDGF